ncbi:hypothetical protein [Leptospirillum ferriphilum]|uniref:Transporter n=1 Tax=Leptospirillum ferriphilum (strain ML-04) TaxID=1048260 RepID=J9ZC87_LEPFM|nr:hypothetical protein [Leptospirillum ferriphilum]AKS23303.1 hypothetical protein ABH19_05395 [Leptospirillum sp. Group II 'CF-1']EAY55907.1 MAG: protein of unknown function [Leptospirillum rubarum]EIJ76343.1 MAG: hypothetical protein C75L2_00490096 [Leptospirillum sp. Group II 'C75']AFS53756.1 hypothetical protein LFML04_1546 [Leptospirillum ferriphilum ML-04]OOH76362.1 hypothetical protein BOX30_10565 [Leptospirillum ferriphilum]
MNIARVFLGGSVLMCLWTGSAWSESSLPGPDTPPPISSASSAPALAPAPDHWSFAPTISYFLPVGSGVADYLNAGLGVGGELSYFPGEKPGQFRWIISGTYFQMTPGPTLTIPFSSSNPFAANPSTSTQQIGPIPGSASVTGFILKTGMAWNLLDLIPADVTGWGAISPYVRMDIGMASLAATDAGNLTGHPYGLLVDGGAGIEWHVPSLSMGVFVEMDPSGLNANGSFLFLAPLVSGISLWF